MAKNMPMMKTGSGLLPRLVSVLVGLALLVFVVKHPSEAAHVVSSVMTTLGNAVDGIARFFSEIKQ